MKKILAAAAVSLAILPAPALAQIDSASVERGADGSLTLSWTAQGPVDVYVATTPDAMPADAEPVSMDDEDGMHIYQPASEAGRTYFVLAGIDGDVRHAAARVLPLEGGRNFRDLGGYPAMDGMSVRWGRLYRSGAMHELTAADYHYLSGLDIAVICDFRANQERIDEPTDWQAGAVDMMNWDYEMDMSSLGAAFGGDMSPERSAAAMTAFYRQMPVAYGDRYAQMFQRIAAGDLPMTFHCSAGKDRTGLAAALILSALGVPRDVILDDYAMSDDLVDYMADLREAREQADPDSPNAFWAQLPEAVIAPFMASDPAYLAAALDQIEADHGSVEAYLQDELGVTDAALAAMRSSLLE